MVRATVRDGPGPTNQRIANERYSGPVPVPAGGGRTTAANLHTQRHARSITMAMPWPTPMHMVHKARLPPVSASW
ncbi:hypothetical protein STVA_30210 [Allostella vacuolata]|nr:hypothetical protein STVA_30210 [Stella vacuolata]